MSKQAEAAADQAKALKEVANTALELQKYILTIFRN